jgi:hypothetical protein
MEILNKYKVESTKGTTYIGRGSPLGNPFPITKELPRLEAIAKYKIYLIQRILSGNDIIINALRSLKEDSRLLCFCAPAPCHGDVIKQIWEEIRSYPSFEEGLKAFQEKYEQ